MTFGGMTYRFIKQIVVMDLSVYTYDNKFKFYNLNMSSLLVNLDFPGGLGGKASACNVRDPSLISGLGRSPGEGNGNPL